jgi:general secretion pathway protein G
MKTESRLQRGFTLIEMVIVISIIVILIAIAVPIYNTHLLHAHEAALLQDLQAMRDSIGQYTQDKNKAPQSLQDLVDAGYMHAIPKDPFTSASDTWQPVQEDVMTALDQTQPGITDVHSGSTRTGSDGRPYNTW